MGNICIECGLCCDGTIFDHAPLETRDDLIPLRAAGVAFDQDLTQFSLPCAALEAQCCSVYESRPSICRAYRCALLKRVESGETDDDSARDIIATVIQLRDQVRPTLSAKVDPEQATTASLNAMLHTVFRDEGGLSPTERAELMLDVAALRTMLAKYFQNPDPSQNPPPLATENLG
jgi:Fe-S-cluster containining protein